MSWQLWTVIALAVTGLVILMWVRVGQARHVFDDITRLDNPHESGQPERSGDEIAPATVHRIMPASAPHRKHG